MVKGLALPNNPKVPIAAFTARCDGRSLQLKNKVHIVSDNNTIEALALWDTGATGTCISERIVKDLGLVSTGKMTISTPSGQAETNTYLVDILLPNRVNITGAQVMDSKIGDQGIDILIGMDIITKGDFSVSCLNGKTCFSFRMPSVEETDFVRGIRIENALGKRHGGGKKNTKKRKRK